MVNNKVEYLFSSGDTVWAVRKNKIVQGKIVKVTILVDDNNYKIITYEVDFGDYGYVSLTENFLFKTVADLIATLQQNCKFYLK